MSVAFDLANRLPFTEKLLIGPWNAYNNLENSWLVNILLLLPMLRSIGPPGAVALFSTESADFIEYIDAGISSGGRGSTTFVLEQDRLEWERSRVTGLRPVSVEAPARLRVDRLNVARVRSPPTKQIPLFCLFSLKCTCNLYIHQTRLQKQDFNKILLATDIFHKKKLR